MAVMWRTVRAVTAVAVGMELHLLRSRSGIGSRGESRHRGKAGEDGEKRSTIHEHSPVPHPARP